MAKGVDCLDAVVIGAGWAGLGVSHALQQRALTHLVLERGQIGETWRRQRWDSFHMNTPNCQTVMPGDTYDGPDPDGALPCRDFIALLEGFAARHRLPVETAVEVTGLTVAADGFQVSVGDRRILARSVVLASGTQNHPQRPPIGQSLPQSLHQIDASDYRNADNLPDGAVLVIGSGQSGGQIAEDLIRSGRSVYLATSRVGRLFRLYRGRHVMHWLVVSGVFDRQRAALLEEGPIATRPLAGSRATISLQSLSAEGVVLLGRLTGCEGHLLRFSDAVAAHLRHGDESAAHFRQIIDDYIRREGIAAPDPQPDPAEVVAAHLPDPPILTLDLHHAGIAAVIWCTGFGGDFSWADVPGLLDDQGQPLEDAAMARVPGLYVPGRPFSVTRKSGTILAVADEAARIAADIARRAAR